MLGFQPDAHEWLPGSEVDIPRVRQREQAMGTATWRPLQRLPRLDFHEAFNTPLFSLGVGPFSIGWQVATECPECPGDFIFLIDRQLGVREQVTHGDGALRRVEFCFQRYAAHRQDCRELINMALESIRLVVWMTATNGHHFELGAAASGHYPHLGLLKPAFVFEHRA